MKASELRSKSIEELKKEQVALTKALFSLRVQQATRQLKNTSQFAKTKKDIARIKTVIKQKMNERS